MAQKKRSASKKKSAKQKEEQVVKTNKQIIAIILMASALILLAIVVIPDKNLGTFIKGFKDICFGIFGFCAYALPVILGYISVMMAFEKLKSNKLSVTCAILFGIFLDTSFEIFGHSIDGANYFKYIGESYVKANESFGGGVLGSLIAYPLTYAFGLLLAKIVIIILIIVALMITTGITLQTIGVFAKKTGEKATRKAQEIHNEKITNSKQKEEPQEVQVIEETSVPRFELDVSLDGMPDHPAVLDEIYKEKEAKEKEKKQAVNIEVEEEKPAKKPIVQKQKAQTVVKEQPKKKAEENKEKREYVFPPIELLSASKGANEKLVESELKSNCELLVNILKSFSVEVRVTGYSRGPSVTRYEIQPAIGVRINKITNLADDIALRLGAANVRISPIPNKSTLGVEVPNSNSSVVGMREIIESDEFKKQKSNLLVGLGKDVTGKTALCDISKMPHLLVAGTTGSGKSVCLNSMIMSILYRSTPDEVKFVMVDPKAVEFPVYNGIPHLLVPVVTDPRKAAGALGWAVIEMEKRYKILADHKVRGIEGYNEICKKNKELEPLPHIVIIIDEFADLMMVAGSEVETSVCRLAQKARAAGMHLVIATQRPSVDIFTGLIKSNIPSRIALSVASATDSRIIIDMLGAEKLLGKGDMLYMPLGSPKPNRIQGCFISDDEVKEVASFIVANSDENEYDQEVLCEIDRQAAEEDGKKSSMDDGDFGDYDARINEAVEVVIDNGMASTSLLQRKLKLGYARAARIMDQLEERGIIGPHQGAKPREVLISRSEWMQMQTTGVVSTAAEPEVQQLSFEDTEEVLEQVEETFEEMQPLPFDMDEEEFEPEFIELPEEELNEETEELVYEPVEDDYIEEENFVEEEVFDEEEFEEAEEIEEVEEETEEQTEEDPDFFDDDFLSSI